MGNPVCFLLSAGNQHDINSARPLLCGLSIDGTVVNADKGYDSQEFADWLISKEAVPNIPSRETNRAQREVDWWQYKERHLIECFWQKIKQYRRIATRYDKLAKSYLSFIYLAAIIVLLK